MCAKSAAVRPRAKPMDTSVGIQALLMLDISIRLAIWGVSLTATLLVLSRTAFARSLSWDLLQSVRGAWGFAATVILFILLFNVAYVLTLVLLRALIPLPERGMYRLAGVPDKNLLFSAFAGILTKARHYPPFPAFLVGDLCNVQPFRGLLGLRFGPRTRSSFFLDPLILDPWGVTIGKNVNIGFGALVTAHLQEKDFVMVDPVVIEDDVLIGAYAGIGCGVHIKRGAFIEPYSAVKPGMVIGEEEWWGGIPATQRGYYRGGSTVPGGKGGSPAVSGQAG
jgi:hypothetical protein